LLRQASQHAIFSATHLLFIGRTITEDQHINGCSAAQLICISGSKGSKVPNHAPANQYNYISFVIDGIHTQRTVDFDHRGADHNA
jgi:hypothetical protein